MTAKRRPFFPALVLLLLLGTACGEDCEEICENRKQCRNGKSDVDCSGQCEQLQELVEKADCTDQYEALNDCINNLDDVCDESPGACESQSRAYTDCMSDYCMDHDCT